MLCKINLFGIKNHYIYIYVCVCVCVCVHFEGIMGISFITSLNIVDPLQWIWKFSAVQVHSICCSKYATRIQAQADNTGNEHRNLQTKKLLTVNNLILSSKLMSTFMFISVNCNNEYGIRQLKCWAKFYDLWTPENFSVLGPQNKDPWIVEGNCSSPPTVCLLLHSPAAPPVLVSHIKQCVSRRYYHVIITTNIATIRRAITFRKCTGWGSLRMSEMCGSMNQWNPLLWHQNRSLKMCPLNIAKFHVLVSI